jgi:hypothetical protein
MSEACAHVSELMPGAAPWRATSRDTTDGSHQIRIAISVNDRSSVGPRSRSDNIKISRTAGHPVPPNHQDQKLRPPEAGGSASQFRAAVSVALETASER